MQKYPNFEIERRPPLRVFHVDHCAASVLSRLMHDDLHWVVIPQRVKTRNSTGDEIANVNFLYDIVQVLQNTIDLCINSATDRRGYVLERMCLPNSVK